MDSNPYLSPAEENTTLSRPVGPIQAAVGRLMSLVGFMLLARTVHLMYLKWHTMNIESLWRAPITLGFGIILMLAGVSLIFRSRWAAWCMWATTIVVIVALVVAQMSASAASQ